jgi:hypothetical protein
LNTQIALRRAILAAVHLTGLPRQAVNAAAEQARARFGAEMPDLLPETWFMQMRPFLDGARQERLARQEQVARREQLARPSRAREHKLRLIKGGAK